MQRSCQMIYVIKDIWRNTVILFLEDLSLKILSSTFILNSATGLKYDICDKKDERFIF